MAIKKPKAAQGKNISVNAESRESTNDITPVFCLEHLQPQYCLSKCEKDEKAAFAEALFKRSKMSWGQIIQADKHGLGCETIKRDAIQAT